jgi:hypothetical protein
MRPPYDAIVARAARLLFPGATTTLFARAFGRPRSTVLGWFSERRRAPIEVLEGVQRRLRERAAAEYALAGDFDYVIHQRRCEPVRRGFFVVRERDGPGSVPRDAQMRWLRPPASEPGTEHRSIVQRAMRGRP